ncbi:multidrug transporter [Salmonella enterica subsp. enterica serovar Heidelberg]|nr:multidrug transporter [Salmonella enterica subsp. enterica serovar Heidelberg]
MNTNVYENTDSETITPLNKRRILPVFLLVGLYAASTAAVMSVLPFLYPRDGRFAAYHWNHHRH